MDQHKAIRIAAIIVGVIISIFLIIIGFKIVTNVFTRASDQIPRDVTITDITQNSARVSWSTGIANQGIIIYGTTPTALNFNAPETVPTTTHSVDLTLLSASSTYYFQISIEGKNYDNGGVPWTFSTKGVVPTAVPTPTISSTTNPTPIQSLKVPNSASTLACRETDCTKIKEKLGKGCDTQDYLRCIRKLTPTPTP